MGVEFKLGRQDHKKVEDFLSRRPAGVAGISIDASLIRYQAAATEAARTANVDVVIEPLTERLVWPGFEPDGLPYYEGHPIDLVRLRGSRAARDDLVEQVLDVQHDIATRLVPPHFYVEDDASAELNLRLARHATRLAGSTPVRPILVIKRKYAIAVATQLAEAYAQLGLDDIDLRVTPFGGDDESAQKIRSVFDVADAFRAAGVEVVLGCSGNIGQAAVALGHAYRYSVGVGMKEKVDHVTAMSRQARPADDDDNAGRFGPQAGVYLPGPAATVRRPVAHAMLADRDIRTRMVVASDRADTTSADLPPILASTTSTLAPTKPRNSSTAHGPGEPRWSTIDCSEPSIFEASSTHITSPKAPIRSRRERCAACSRTSNTNNG